MKLILPHCRNCQSAILLNVPATTRGNLRTIFGGDNFRVQCGTCDYESIYNVSEVIAKTDDSQAATGVIVGGLVGILAGPIGMLIGSGLGGLIGNTNDKEDQKKVKNFNESW